MSIHIKRDGRFLCNKDLSKSKYLMDKDRYSFISFQDAIKAFSLHHCCNECSKEFYAILNRLPEPIQV